MFGFKVINSPKVKETFQQVYSNREKDIFIPLDYILFILSSGLKRVYSYNFSGRLEQFWFLELVVFL